MSPDLLLAIDQGTTSTRAFVFDRGLRVMASASRPIRIQHPRPGWAEQNPDEILESVVECTAEVLASCGGPERIAAVGLDNQGETVVAWDETTGAALSPAIVWQCRRSEPIVERLRSAGLEPELRRLTGLPLDPYFSAGKMTWLLEEVPAVQTAASRRTLRLGTVDAWLTWNLAGEALTDASTASRTQLLDIHSLTWNDRLLDTFGVPRAALPRIVPSAGPAGNLHHARWGPAGLPLMALVCDQQAALIGHGCVQPGQMKATYGTGVFVLAVAGPQPPVADGLLSTVGWQLRDERTTYALDGGVFTAGSLLDWLRDGLGLLANPAESEELARSVPDTAGVQLLPALAGIGAPWWRPRARGVIAGLTAATTRAHIARAALDGIGHRVADIVEAMTVAMDRPPLTLRVDGGLTGNGYLLQRQADLLDMPLEVASSVEATALGAAGLAGIGLGWIEAAQIGAANPPVRTVRPLMADVDRLRERAAWRRFVEKAADLGDGMHGAAHAALTGKEGKSSVIG
ncbi:MAG: FGGY family carbohydrate kinase [Chloroflexota bacterium]